MERMLMKNTDVDGNKPENRDHKYIFSWKDKPTINSNEKWFEEIFNPRNFDEDIEAIGGERYNFPISDCLIEAKYIRFINDLETNTNENISDLYISKESISNDHGLYKEINLNHEDVHLSEMLYSYIFVPIYISYAKAAIKMLDMNLIEDREPVDLLDDLKKYISAVIKYLENQADAEAVELSSKGKFNSSLQNILDKIDDLVHNQITQATFDNEGDVYKYIDNLKLRKLKIRHLLEEIPSALTVGYEVRYSMLRAFKQKFQIKELSTNHILQLTIDENEFNSKVNFIAGGIINSAENMFQCLFTIEDYNSRGSHSFITGQSKVL